MNIRNFSLFKNKEPENIQELRHLHYYLSVRSKLGKNWFFDEINLTSEYQKTNFGFEAFSITISNDNNDKMYFSWNGIDLAGIVYKSEVIDFMPIEKENIYVKGEGSIRIWAM